MAIKKVNFAIMCEKAFTSARDGTLNIIGVIEKFTIISRGKKQPSLQPRISFSVVVNYAVDGFGEYSQTLQIIDSFGEDILKKNGITNGAELKINIKKGNEIGGTISRFKNLLASPGKYTLKIFINKKLKKSISFEIKYEQKAKK
jgi:hypothetical protein